MAKKVYFKSNGVAKDVLLYDMYIKNNSGVGVMIKEGSFIRKSDGIAYPLLRFDTIPFGGRVSSSNMIFQLGISDKLLFASPKVACIGSSTMAGFGLSNPNRLEDRL